MKLGPNNTAEEIVFAEENLKVDVQHCIVSAMNKQNVSRAELARRMGTSEQHVSQLFSSGSNPTVKTIARIFFALGDECFFSSRQLDEAAHARQKSCPWVFLGSESGETEPTPCARVYPWSAPTKASAYKLETAPREERRARSA